LETTTTTTTTYSMVQIEEVSTKPEESPQETRQLDAECLEALLGQVSRESAKLHLTNLISKLQKEASALRRVEASKAKLKAEAEVKTEASSSLNDSSAPTPTPVNKTVAVSKPPVLAASNKYIPIDSFAFDAGGYNSQFVTLYISLPSVGSVDRSNITCEFTKGSFDLIVREYQGNKTMRLMRDNLEKDIDAEKSKIVVKADKILVKLSKVKGEYGSYDSWTDLVDKKGKKKKATETAKDPQASIMDLMKDMYDSGDDQMKKMIGETMLKQREGTLGKEGIDKDSLNF